MIIDGESELTQPEMHEQVTLENSNGELSWWHVTCVECRRHYSWMTAMKYLLC